MANNKKSLKIQKGKSKSVNQRTDNTTVKRKKKGQTTQRSKEKKKDNDKQRFTKHLHKSKYLVTIPVL